MNPRSGGGKAERFALAEECRRRGIEPVILEPGDDLLDLARGAIDRGADVIGMAGGDGSQALVASVAMAADVPLVCVPAGTRNRFALDLGMDRNDVVAALDAFDAAVERRIDLGTVNGRVFVNNVSLGVYAKIVRSPSYREAKRQTTTAMLSDLVGPRAEPFDLHLIGPDGTRQDRRAIIQVSNNPYRLTSFAGFGSRARLDTGELGVAAVDLRGARDIVALLAAQWTGRLDRFRGWTRWETDKLTIESSRPIEAGVDGEALLFDPPLELRSLPGALRVRIPTTAPGHSPAALQRALAVVDADRPPACRRGPHHPHRRDAAVAPLDQRSVVEAVPQDRAGHAVTAAAALPELEAGDLHHLDTRLSHLGDGVGVPLVGDDHAGLERDDVVAVVPLLPLLLVLVATRLDDVELRDTEGVGDGADEVGLLRDVAARPPGCPVAG